MKKHLLLGALTLLTLGLGLGGCEATHGHGAEHAKMWANVTTAVAVLHAPDPANATVTGLVKFTQVGDKVHVVADISGLAANTQHGFHIHEFGDVSASADKKYDGLNAGGHYNPEGATHQHAGMDSAMRHAGDFGNVTADGTGNAHLDVTVDNISIAGMKNPIIGRGVVLHANPDDLKTQPTGNAGGRIAVGVIGIGK